MTETPLIAETRSVDDQVEWLDERHILYTPMIDAPAASFLRNEGGDSLELTAL